VQHTASVFAPEGDIKCAIRNFLRKVQYTDSRYHCYCQLYYSAVKGEEITEGVPDKGINEDLQMKDASEEAVACSVLSAFLLHHEAN